MCLWNISDKSPNSFGSGYKIMRQVRKLAFDSKGEHVGWKSSGRVRSETCLAGINSPRKDVWVHDQNQQELFTEGEALVSYPTGFHILLNKDDAYFWITGFENLTLFECEYSDAIVIGNQYMGNRFAPVVVARSIKLGRRICSTDLHGNMRLNQKPPHIDELRSP